MITIDNLKAFGADTDEGLTRCYGNESLYLRLVNMIPAETNFDVLQQAINDNDLDKAFEASHALKGVLGNLSLTPMYEKCTEITELLRARTDMDYTHLLAELLELRNTLRDMCTE